MTRLIGLAAIAAFGMGCATLPQDHLPLQNYAEHNAEENSTAFGPVTFHVVNDRIQDVNVFAVQNGFRVLVGTVRGQSRATFEVPRVHLSSAASFHLLADPRQSTLDVESGPVLLKDARNVEWRLRRGGGERIRLF